jgi:hypothetical protein
VARDAQWLSAIAVLCHAELKSRNRQHGSMTKRHEVRSAYMADTVSKTSRLSEAKIACERAAEFSRSFASAHFSSDLSYKITASRHLFRGLESF